MDASSKVRIQNRNVMTKKKLAQLQKLATNAGRSTLPYSFTNSYVYKLGERMKVYLVYGDTYFEKYGSDFHLFGVFTSKQAAEEVKKQKEDEFYQQEMKKKSLYRNIDSREEVEFEIKEMQLDKICDLLVGGYVE